MNSKSSTKVVGSRSTLSCAGSPGIPGTIETDCFNLAKIMFPEFLPGAIIDDRYQVLASLGSGGMGSVLKVRELSLGREMALKILRPDLLSDRDSQQRFIREGKVLASLDHPHILGFYRFGTWSYFAYIASEFVAGNALSAVIADEGRLTPERVVNIGIQICRGMAYAHARDIIHRDLKPANVMLLVEPADFVKVVDFGLAKVLQTHDDKQRLTSTGTLLGSLHYMSPEQCCGKAADVRSDIYSLGCLLYEALCGEPPLVADNPIGQMHLHVNVTPERLHKRLNAPKLAELDNLLFQSMAKDPSERFRSMEEFEHALQMLRSEHCNTIRVIAATSKENQGSRRKILGAALALTATAILMVAFQSVHTRLDHANWNSNIHQVQDSPSPVGHKGLIAEGLAFYQQGKLDLARKSLKKALSVNSDDSSARLQTFVTLARLDEQVGRYVDAEKELTQALGLSKQAFGEQSAQAGDQLLALASNYAKQHKFVEAQSFATQALTVSHITLQPNSTKLASRLQHLAQVFISSGNLGQAEAQQREVVEIVQRLLPPTDSMVIDYRYQLAEIYLREKKYDQAKHLLQEILSIVDKSQPSNNSRIADVLHLLCRGAINQDRYREAEPLARKALKIRETQTPNNAEQTAESLIFLSDILLHERKAAEAEALLVRALRIRRRLFSAGDYKIAECFPALISSLIAQNKLTEAASLLQEDLLVKDRSQVGIYDVKIALTIQALADALARANRYDIAESLYRRTLAVAEKINGSTSPIVALHLHSVAVSLLRQGARADEAERLLRRALLIDERAFGEQDARIVTSLRLTGESLLYQGKQEEAISKLRRALAIDELAYGKASFLLLTEIVSLANALHGSGMHCEAELLFRRALAIEKSRGASTGEFASRLNDLASVLIPQMKYREAEALLRKALSLGGTGQQRLAACLVLQGKYGELDQLVDANFSKSSQTIGAHHFTGLLCIRASALALQGKHAESETLFQKAVDSANENKLFPARNALLAPVDLIADALRLQGRFAESEMLYRKALNLLSRELKGRQQQTAAGGAFAIPLTNISRSVSDTEIDHLNLIGSVLMSQGKMVEANHVLLSALELCQAAPGTNPFRTTQVLGLLSLSLSRQGKYAEAEPFLRRALAISAKDESEPSHLTARTEQLASNLMSQRKYSEAEALYRRACHLRETLCHSDTSHLLESRTALRACLRAQGKNPDVPTEAQ